MAPSKYSDDNEFSAQLQEMGLKLREIPGDGNCLFRALNDQIEGHSDNHLYYREETADFMMKHKRDFEPFVEDDCLFEDYVCNLRKDGTYAGNDAIVAFARRFDVKVIIHQACAPLWIIEGGCCHSPELHIAYHNGDHYSSIRKIGDDAVRPAKIWLCDVKKYTKLNSKVKKTPENIQELVHQVMVCTECTDCVKIEKLLQDHAYDVEKVVSYMLERNPCRMELEEDVQRQCDETDKPRSTSSCSESGEPTLSSQRTHSSGRGRCSRGSQSSSMEQPSDDGSCNYSTKSPKSKKSSVCRSEGRAGSRVSSSCEHKGSKHCAAISSVRKPKKKKSKSCEGSKSRYSSTEERTPKPKKRKKKKDLPIICKNLSDIIVNSASQLSQQSIPSACDLNKRSSTEMYLNITLGVLCAFLVYCLFKAF